MYCNEGCQINRNSRGVACRTSLFANLLLPCNAVQEPWPIREAHLKLRFLQEKSMSAQQAILWMRMSGTSPRHVRLQGCLRRRRTVAWKAQRRPSTAAKRARSLPGRTQPNPCTKGSMRPSLQPGRTTLQLRGHGWSRINLSSCRLAPAAARLWGAAPHGMYTWGDPAASWTRIMEWTSEATSWR